MEVDPAPAPPRAAAPEAIVERIMTAHWDLAACPCWICVEGRAAGLGPKEKYLKDRWRYNEPAAPPPAPAPGMREICAQVVEGCRAVYDPHTSGYKALDIAASAIRNLPADAEDARAALASHAGPVRIAHSACKTCGDTGLVADGLPSNGPVPCPDCASQEGPEPERVPLPGEPDPVRGFPVFEPRAAPAPALGEEGK